tara:strand:- start:294 stop:476 length:183 start_codon:yes stop_codon:yes gene_type:complete
MNSEEVKKYESQIKDLQQDNINLKDRLDLMELKLERLLDMIEKLDKNFSESKFSQIMHDC